jgi:hypothetical protein
MSTNLETPIDGVPFGLPYSQQVTHIASQEKKDEEKVSVYNIA